MQEFDRARQALAISLAALAGFVDAAGFLSADGYFVSFMSGNTTRFGVNVAQDGYRALTPALLLIGFVIGVAAGGVIAIRFGRWRKPAVLGLVTLLLAMGAALRAEAQADASLAMLVLAMGALNNTFQRNGEITVGLTYMTGALVKLGQGIAARLTGGRRSDWPAYLVLWAGLAAGAIGGAAAYLHMGQSALWIATGVSGALTLTAARLVAPPAA